MSTYYSGNRYLTYNEMKTNAEYICFALVKRGWTLNAISAMLGNMQAESTINPAIWEGLNEGNTEGGYGLVQWTPATKYLDWCSERGLDPASMDSALLRIDYEVENGLQWIPTETYPMTFEEFKQSTGDVKILADTFLKNYERPANLEQPTRQTNASTWFYYLGKLIPEKRKRQKMPLWFLAIMVNRRRARVVR